METIVCISETTICAREVIAGVAGIIVSAEMIDSLTPLIAHGIEILRSQSSTIADEVEIIANGPELIVTMISSKEKTGGKEAGKPGVFDVKLSASLVWIVVFPFMPPHRAARVPFLTR